MEYPYRIHSAQTQLCRTAIFITALFVYINMSGGFSKENIVDEITAKGLSDGMQKELLRVLDKEWPSIVKLRESFNSKRTNKNYIKLKRHFPIFNDATTKLKKFEDYSNMGYMIVVSKLIIHKMGEFRESTVKKMEHLRNFIYESGDAEGKKVYDFLTANNTRVDDIDFLIKELQNAIHVVKKEFQAYNFETEAYEQRSIEQVGMETNDAIKCLTDFSGRTFPFLRTISSEIKAGDTVLELGLGTGILSIAAVMCGAKEAVGIELNPVTCMLAKSIADYLESNGVIRKGSITILWGNFLKFATEEHKSYRNKRFDILISENIYTGMFYELQMQGIKHSLDAGLIKSTQELDHGMLTNVSLAKVIPKALSSMLQPAEITGYKGKNIAETLIDLKNVGAKVVTLATERIYDQIRMYAEEPSNIESITKFKIQKNGMLNCIDISSQVCMMDGDYISRNENKFLSNDSVLMLNKPIKIVRGDIILVGIAYNGGDSMDDVVLEVRKLNADGSVNIDYGARLAIPEEKHRENKRRFEIKNSCKQPLNLMRLGDYEVSRSASFYEGYERVWLADIDYINEKPYSV